MSINKTTKDFADCQLDISNHKIPVAKHHLNAWSIKGKTEIKLGDKANTTIYCSKKKDPEVVEFTYRRHLGLDTSGLRAPEHMVNNIEPEYNGFDFGEDGL